VSQEPEIRPAADLPEVVTNLAAGLRSLRQCRGKHRVSRRVLGMASEAASLLEILAQALDSRGRLVDWYQAKYVEQQQEIKRLREEIDEAI
jgi:hypothetical protein